MFADTATAPHPHRRTAVLTALLGALILLITFPVSARAGEILSTGALQHVVATQLADAGGTASALVVDESTGQTLVSDAATAPRLPASVEKLFTTSTALFDFGPRYRFSTDVDGVGSLRDGVFSGTLYLKGGGDPTFGDAAFDQAAYGGSGATVQQLLKHLHAAGVSEIRGKILGDASIFDGLGGGPDTGYRPNLETEGELSGLAYDAGFTNAEETALQPDPALWATQAFAAVAPIEGIRIAKGTKLGTGTTPAGARRLAKVNSPTVATLLELTNSPSDNFFAEELLKDLGHFYGSGGSTAVGASLVEETVARRLGLSVRTDDGSGLSRYDRVTATAVVRLLEEMQSSPALYDSLAIAGVRGTMQDEMVGTSAAGNCRGKTGTLHDVANLVGYCTAANGQQLVFAFLENSLEDSTYGHATEDVMAEALAAYAGEGRGSPAPTLPDPDAGAKATGTPPPTLKVTSTTTTPTTTTPTATSTTPTGTGPEPTG